MGDISELRSSRTDSFVSRHPGRRGAIQRAAIASVGVVVLAAAWFFVDSIPNAQAAAVSLTLYGRAATGWSFSAGGETNPGPTIAVDAGDSVTVHLISEDAMPHALFVDLDDNSGIGPGDITTNSTLDDSFTFTVRNAPGSHYYYCSIHSGGLYGVYNPGAPMYGLFVVNGGPIATFAAPSAGTAWTGGAAHDIRFNLVDEDPPTSVTFWANYSYNGGTQGGPIIGPVTGTANPNIVGWTPARFNATDVAINVTARDSTGVVGYSRSVPFEVDSSAPAITARAPAANAVGVPLNSKVQVTWSEGMNTVASGASDALGVRRISDGTWIPGGVSWSPDSRQMTFTPGASWDAITTFEVRVNTTAKDDSAPGNAFAAPDTWQFTTGMFSDTTPPAIANVAANPGTQGTGGLVTIRADVTDDVTVSSVNAHVQGPSTDVNLTMTNTAGSTWTASRTYATPGTHTFVVWAIDGSGNANSGSGAFSITAGSLPAPSLVMTVTQAGAAPSVVVTWSAVSDSNVTGYHVHRSETAGGPYTKLTTSPVPASGPLRYVDSAVQADHTYHYVVTAVDAGGHESPFSVESTIAIASGSPAASADYLPWIVVVIAATGVLLVVAFVLRRRRRPENPAK